MLAPGFTMAFQKSSLGWELQQLAQRINEWIEARWREESPASPPFDLPQWDIPEWLVRGFFWALLAGILGWWLWKIGPTLKRLWVQWGSQILDRSLLTAPPQTQPQSPQHWLLRSQKLARQEQYPEACRALYFALLQWFHEQAIIPQSLSRTDGEYVALLAKARFTTTQIDSAAIVIEIHQRLCFSTQSIDQQEFLQCQKAIQRLNL